MNSIRTRAKTILNFLIDLHKVMNKIIKNQRGPKGRSLGLSIFYVVNLISLKASTRLWVCSFSFFPNSISIFSMLIFFYLIALMFFYGRILSFLHLFLFCSFSSRHFTHFRKTVPILFFLITFNFQEGRPSLNLFLWLWFCLKLWFQVVRIYFYFL